MYTRSYRQFYIAKDIYGKTVILEGSKCSYKRNMFRIFISGLMTRSFFYHLIITLILENLLPLPWPQCSHQFNIQSILSTKDSQFVLLKSFLMLCYTYEISQKYDQLCDINYTQGPSTVYIILHKLHEKSVYHQHNENGKKYFPAMPAHFVNLIKYGSMNKYRNL